MDETILVNYLQGECNDEEAARVEAWCEEGPENRKTLEQLYYTLFVGERIAVMNTVDTEASLDQCNKKRKNQLSEKRRKRLSGKVFQSVGDVMLLWRLLFLPDSFLPVELPGDYFLISFRIMR